MTTQFGSRGRYRFLVGELGCECTGFFCLLGGGADGGAWHQHNPGSPIWLKLYRDS